MNICFISNFSKTYLYEAVGKNLQQQGIEVYWIATNRKLFTHLVREFGEKYVLLLNRKHAQQKNQPIGEFKLHELIFGDRVLRHQPNQGKQFLKNIQRPVYDFLQQNNVRKVYGEITWAHEILIHRICTAKTELNCQFLNPHVIRIPDNRFGFFTDERQSQLLEVTEKNDCNWLKLTPKTPEYIAINKKILKKASSLIGKLDRIKRFVTNENIDPLDPTLLTDHKKRIRQGAREEWQREQYKSIRTSSYQQLPEKPYVFLGLHKQPEASVDVFGRYYEDQLQNILNLWRALPTDWNLLIKEHSIAIGDRPIHFYKKIQALPNVFLIDEKIPSQKVIRNASLVATVTGTMAYEAALFGIPAITFAPVFFNKLNKCRQITLEDLNKFDLKEIAQELNSTPDNINTFSKYIYTNSFKGNVIDPVSAPKVLNQENIQLLSEAFIESLLIPAQPL